MGITKVTKCKGEGRRAKGMTWKIFMSLVEFDPAHILLLGHGSCSTEPPCKWLSRESYLLNLTTFESQTHL